MRSITVDDRLNKRSLLEVLQTCFRLKRKAALSALRHKHVRICGGVCVDPTRRVKGGQTIQLAAEHQRLPSAGLPAIARRIVVRHLDNDICVVEKPAGLTTVRHATELATLGQRSRKHLPPTLVDLLPQTLACQGTPTKGRIRAVHRIDKETSGLVVLARTPQAESNLGKQFRAHSIGRRYLALVRGVAKDVRIESRFVADRGDGRRGSGPDGQVAITHVRVLESFDNYSLVECELETGRTHQVRIHLGEAGTPLCGERVYDRPLHGKPLPDASGATRPMLHAAYLAFDHPATGERMEWRSKLSADMDQLVHQWMHAT
jgi:23S rRNA pseudouridine1911/1915/1917 synthase